VRRLVDNNWECDEGNDGGLMARIYEYGVQQLLCNEYVTNQSWRNPL